MTNREQGLLDAAASIDVLDLAGTIIGNPRRARVSSAGEMALACAVEAFWAVALEAECLVAALDALADAGPDERATLRERCLEHSLAIRREMAAMRGTNHPQQEN